jgi:hypothetical protein
VINALRAHMAELGIVGAQVREGTNALLAIIADDGDEPVDARASLIVLAAQLQALQTLVGLIEKRIIAQHRASEASKRLAARDHRRDGPNAGARASFRKDSLKVLRDEHEQMVRALAPDRADQAFNISVLPWRAE